MKDKITEQSILLFEKKGFTETSIQDIVDSLNVTKGTFYYYFSSKEELLMDIQLEYINNLLDRQEQILKDGNKNCKEKLYEIVYLLISMIKSQRAAAKIFHREINNLSSDHLNQIIPKRDQFRLNVEWLLKKGIETGEFREDLNTSIVTFGILGVTNWSYHWFNPNGAVSDQEVAEIFVEMILKGIQTL